jgi:DNA-binding beta-propeller fold protein YncE
MKFSVKGKFIKQWGERGKKPGQFNLPHSILVDKQGRILVGDRENNRVQVFDSEGKLLKIWSGFAPFGLVADRDETIFVADGRANQLLRLDAAGKVAQRWGRKGRAPGEFNLPHMLAVDRNANLYVVEIGGMRLQKFIRKR